MTARKNSSKKPTAKPTAQFADILALADIAAEKLTVEPEPNHLYNELIGTKITEAGSLDSVEKVIWQVRNRDTKDPYKLAERLELLAVEAGADKEAANQIGAELEDAFIEHKDVAQEACFMIGVANPLDALTISAPDTVRRTRLKHRR